jgi:hypothetical protein
MYSTGDEVIIRGGFGMEPPQRVTVTGVGTKRGKIVYDYVDKGGNNRWFYEWQIKK